MAKADSVHSTPPTNTSPTRRKILCTIATGTVAALASTIAEPGAAALPADPIYAAIERHKQTAVIWDAAALVEARFPSFNMTDEQARQNAILAAAREAAWDPCEQAGIDLITTEPTTSAGIVAAIRYIRIQMRDDGTFMPHQIEFEFEFDSGSEGDGGETLGWVDVFLETIADATAALAASA
jgi:hypothetical protein